MRPEKDSGYSDRDIIHLLDRGYDKNSWSNSPPCVADGRQDIAAVFVTQGRRRLIYRGKSMSIWLISYQGNRELRHGASM